MVSIPPLFIRPQPTSAVRCVAFHYDVLSVVVALHGRKNIGITAVLYHQSSWFLVYGTGRGYFYTV